jgi:Spy/CpxP family protein refolding chaperone
MTRTIWRRGLTLVLTALLLGSVAAAQAAEATKGEPGHGPRGARLKEALGLSDEQTQAIRDIMRKNAEGHRQQHQALRQAQRDLRQLVMTGAEDTAVQAKKTEIEQLLAQTVEMRLNALKEIAPVLTPEQRAKFAETMEQYRGHRGHRHGPRGPRPPQS